MNEQEIQDIHTEHKYYASLKALKPIKGLTLTLPKNIISCQPEESYIYEICDNLVNIYTNGMKIDVIKCPNYVARFIISTDVTSRVNARNMSVDLIFSCDEYGNINKAVKKGVIYLIEGPEDQDDIDLENILFASLKKYAKTGNMSDIDDRVIEGFILISERYI